MKSKNIPILSLALALSQSGPPIIVLLAGILGVEMAPTPTLATLPIALMVIGVAIFVIPASLLMRRIGRKRGFILAALVASFASFLAYFALASNNFVLLCTSTLLVGLNGAFVQQYRFAAVESVAPEHAGRAVSSVLIGGIAAAFLGPEIAKRSLGLISGNEYGAAFIALGFLYLLAIALLANMDSAPIQATLTTSIGRSLGEIMRQKNFLLAIMAGAVSYGAMTFVMTATPIYMKESAGFVLGDTAFVIQSHIIAMYLPSLVSGILIERIGLARIMLAGAVVLLLSAIVGSTSSTLGQYWLALVFLGLGWNLLFVGATVLLTHTYQPSERFKVQATNDFIVFGVQAAVSFSAGTVLFLKGWVAINLIGFTVVFAALIVLLIHRRSLPLGTVKV